MPLLTEEPSEDAYHLLTGSTKMEDSGGVQTRETEEDDEAVVSAMMEPSTLQWPGDRQTGGQTGAQTGGQTGGQRGGQTGGQTGGQRGGQTGGQTGAQTGGKTGGQTGGQTGKEDRTSVRSDLSLREAASWTESERGLMVEGERAGPRTHLEEEPVENHLPEKAAQVFSPAVTVLSSPSSPRESEAFWEMESEKSPFLSPRGAPQDYNQHGYHYEWTEDTPPATCGRGCPSRDVLKMGVSLMTSALFFPFLVWGGFVFLPFDAPLLDAAALRLVYTLRCSVFAACPIILGWLVLGVSRLRSGVIRPLLDDDMKEAEPQEVAVHRRFVSDSTSLFLIYFLQLVVMAMYLSQEQLKLVPLLTVVFALGRLVYWAAAAFGSSIRGFGFGLSFLPGLAMMAANFYFIFTVDAAGSVFSLPSPPEEVLTPPAGKQRFWG